MFKAIRTDKNLRFIDLKAEAKLSDMFVLLYIIYSVAANGKTISKFQLQKALVYILENLEKTGKLAEYHIFNLPFYKWTYGPYNSSLETKYLDDLVTAGLVKKDDTNPLVFSLEEKGAELIEEYNDRVKKDEEINFIDSSIDEFTKKYLINFDFGTLKRYSHGIKIRVGNSTKTIDDLEDDVHTAVVYNTDDFNNGKKSDIIPEAFLTKLSLILQDKQPDLSEANSEKILSGIL